MSIRLQHVSKVFGTQKALDDVSFEVGEGEIVGFLGPNGAGKSTTMKIITGFIPASSGLVDVGGFDVLTRPGRVKKLIGYLPEHNPLYTDMYVREFLTFTGRLYGFHGKALELKVGEIVERCGLGPEQNKKIEALSKGYRQRVGLAHALLHDPKILILDEPTTGLDPNQLVEIRKLIRDVSLNKTVLFSSHIMQEVQALCDRVIVISKGRVVADDTLANLTRSGSERKTIVLEFDNPVNAALLKTIPAVSEVIEISPVMFRVFSASEDDVRSAIFRFVADNNLSLKSLRSEENSLEAVFQELTR